MAFLGYNGIVTLQRTSPEPVIVPAIAVNKGSHYITVNYDDWLFAEEVFIIHSTGVLGGMIYRDPLDRIFFHTTRDGALSNRNETRILLSSVDTTKPVVLVASSNATQRFLLSSFQTTLSSISTTSETRLRAWPAVAAAHIAAATENPWRIQGEMKKWEFSRTASEIDTGSLGEKFGTHIKSTVSGSGTMDFIVDIYDSSDRNDIDAMLRLVQLTEYGSAGSARFYLKQASRESYENGRLGANASIFFETSILITSSGIQVSVDGAVEASASFVTTGEIRLLSE